MERLVQLLDDLDDLVWAIRLTGERIRSRILSILKIAFLVAVQAGGILLASVHAPLALGLALVLFSCLLYRSVTAAHVPLEIA